MGGAELAVTEGLEKTIMKNRELNILMEFSPHLYREYGYDPDEFLASMIEKGFSIFEIDEESREVTSVPMENRFDLTRENRPLTNTYLKR